MPFLTSAHLTRTATAVAALSLALTACTASGDRAENRMKPSTEAAAAEAPRLEEEWSIPGLNANPQSVGPNHWVTFQAITSGIGRGTHSVPGPTLLVDARTGRTRAPSIEPDRFPCLMPSVISDDGIAPIFWSNYTFDFSGSRPTEDCTRVTVVDTATGRTIWHDDSLDLSGLSPQRAVGADDSTVAVVDSEGEDRCFAARTGEPVAEDVPNCAALTERLTHADVPDLVDADGESAPLTDLWAENDPTVVEVGRTDDVLLVRTDDHATDDAGNPRHTWAFRAHDLSTGQTLWQDDDVTPDPHQGDTWNRSEVYFVAPSGIARITYDHPAAAEDAYETPAVVVAVDPRTGEDIGPVAQLPDGAWFNRQFSDMLVALTAQAAQLNSTISGFRLPTW